MTNAGSDFRQRWSRCSSTRGAAPDYQAEHTYPPGLAHREQVVRGYDRLGRIADGVRVADGGNAEVVIVQMLARPDIRAVHLRNVEAGCYNFAVRRG